MSTIDPAIMDGYRPLLRGHRHMAVAGHYLAVQAALKILESGATAIDAGVAGGLVLTVVHSEYVNLAGVAPRGDHQWPRHLAGKSTARSVPART